MEIDAMLDAALEDREVPAIGALLLLQQDESRMMDIFHVADSLNQRANGNKVSFIHSAHVHYTNICKSHCRFCSFRRREGTPGAFTLTPQEVAARVGQTADVSEVCLQGGLNPNLNLNYFCQLISEVKRRFSHLHMSAFSPGELAFVAKKAHVPIHEAFLQLKEAGLDSMPGTGAEILNDKLRKKICPDKFHTHEWIDIIRTAHRLGIKTTATIMFGHIENEIHIAEHLEIIRSIQKETAGFTAFVPTPFVPNNTKLTQQNKKLRMTSPESIMKLFAVSRIFYHNVIPHLQANWVTMGWNTAIKTLSVGSNDLGGTMFDHAAIHVGNFRNGIVTPPKEIETKIRKAGKIPQRRDALFNKL